jgi:hypothetical protein
MTAEESIDRGQLSSAQAALVEEAFLQVWASVEACFHDAGPRNEARLRLAGILLLLVRVTVEADFLRGAAFRAFTGDSDTYGVRPTERVSSRLAR